MGPMTAQVEPATGGALPHVAVPPLAPTEGKPRPTRIMRQGVRQYLAGIVTNEHLNVVRRDYDLLKATLTNCVRHGWESQNREGHADFRAHLTGRVSFVEMVNATRAARLRELLDEIQW